MESGPLTDDDKALLDFPALTWRLAGNRDAEIRRQFGVSSTRFHQQLMSLVERKEALEYAPVTVHRLRRLRATRAVRRSAAKGIRG